MDDLQDLYKVDTWIEFYMAILTIFTKYLNDTRIYVLVFFIMYSLYQMIISVIIKIIVDLL